MRVKLDDYHDKESLIGQRVLFTSVGPCLHEATIARYADGGKCVQMTLDHCTTIWEYTADATVIEVLGEKP